MGGKIFINYRRGDDAGFTQALYLRLEDDFVADDLFMDVEGHIRPGDDFVEVLNAQIAASDVVLVVIGSRWAELLDARQEDPSDFVAIEIKAALDQGKRVIPVLVGGASMPRSETLPVSLSPLGRRNALGLRPDRFKADCQGLVTFLKECLDAAQQERAARSETEREAAVAARFAAESEAAARAQGSEERERELAATGVPADEIRKAVELENWNFVKDRNEVQYLRDHLARFAGGTTEQYALSRLDDLVWSELSSTSAEKELRAYLNEFPNGIHIADARSRIDSLNRETIEARTTQGRFKVGAMAFMGILIVGLTGSGIYVNWKYRASLEDSSLKVLDRLAEQTLKPKDIFKECDTCPIMVVIPAGSFVMGSSIRLGDADERPQRTVSISHNFAVAKFEVTFEEWDACVDSGACNRYRPDDEGWGRGRQPVINVSWIDAKSYAAWLSAKTGQSYRLLTEAEWEYVARAGSTARWSFGDDWKQVADYAWHSENSSRKTQPVGQKKPNGMGVHDIYGNVWEWVQDCFGNYAIAPLDGMASGEILNCTRVLRGGAWQNSFFEVRAAKRISSMPNTRSNDNGFRVARSLYSPTHK